MELFLDALLDALIDGVKMLPFLYLAYLLIEWLERHHGESIEGALAGGGRWGFIPGALLAVCRKVRLQCGGLQPVREPDSSPELLAQAMFIALAVTINAWRRAISGSRSCCCWPARWRLPSWAGVRILGNPTNGYTPFMLSGLMMNGLQIGIMLTIAPLLILELLRRRYDWNYAAWLHLQAVRWIPYWLLAMAGYLISLFVAVHWFAVPMAGSWLDAAALGGVQSRGELGGCGNLVADDGFVSA